MKPVRLFRRFHLILLASALAAMASAQTKSPVPVYRWTTLAGRASVGSEDGPAAEARFNNPHGLAMDLTGNLYIADTGNHTIRKISAAGVVSTFAGLTQESGSANGTGSAARFNNPQGIAADLNGNVYVADTGNHTIRKITPAGFVTTLAGQTGIKGAADGAAASALFDSPDRLTVDTQGNVYLNNNGVRKISGGQVQTLSIPAQALHPDGKSVTIKSDHCPAVDAAGQLYFATSIPGEIARIDAAGIATVFRNSLYGVYNSGSYYAYHYTGDAIFNGAAGDLFLEAQLSVGGNIVREIRGLRMQSDGVLGGEHAVLFSNPLGQPTAPLGLAIDSSGNWRYTRPSDDAILTQDGVYAGTLHSPEGLDGIGPSARLDGAGYLTMDPSGNVWFAETVMRYVYQVPSEGYLYATGLRKISPAGTVETIIPPQFSSYLGERQTYPQGLTADSSGKVYLAKESTNYSDFSNEIIQLVADGTLSSFGVTNYDAYFRSNLTADRSGTLYQVFDAIQYQWVHEELTVKQRQSDGTWVTIAGGDSKELKDGTGSAARFKNPSCLTADREGNILLLDSASSPTDPAVYIRKISPTGVVTTVSKKLTNSPSSLAMDSKGTFFLTHSNLGIITQIDINGDEVVIGGIAGKSGSKDGAGDQARFASPGQIVVDAQDYLYLVDGFGTTVRKGEYLGSTPGIVTQPQSQTVATGGSVQFSVTASSATALNYQWFFNGSAFSGATSNTLGFTNARSADAGDYTVIVSNAIGSVTSAKANLTVTSAPVSPPTPTPEPAGGGSGGGGAIEAWFGLVVLAFISTRGWRLKRAVSR